MEEQSLYQILQRIQPFSLGGVFLILYIAEHVYPQKKSLIDYVHDLRNLGIGLVNGVLVVAAGYGMQQVLEWAVARHWGLLSFVGISGLFHLILAFFLQDVIMYFWHRANHRIRFLWRFHKFHHVDTKMNSTTALRFHFIELLLSYFFKVPLLLLFGITVTDVLLYGIVFTAVVIFHHSGIRMPRRIDFILRGIIVTPLMHRIHHSTRQQETDSNYASVFSFWDKIFGSYTKEPVEEITFGIE